jgi:hypothetical protein
MKYAAVYTPTGVIGELRSGDQPPDYVPEDYEWVDVTGVPLSDQQMIGSTWDGAQVILKAKVVNLNPKFDMGKTMHEILTG